MTIGARPERRDSFSIADGVLGEFEAFGDLFRDGSEIFRRSNFLVRYFGVDATVDDAEDGLGRIVVLADGLDRRERLVLRDRSEFLRALLDGVLLGSFSFESLGSTAGEKSRNDTLHDPSLSSEVDQRGRHRVQSVNVEPLEHSHTSKIL